jgi:hypothetical protein
MVMSRLIDADKLLNKIDAYMCGSQDVMFVKELIKEQPTAFDVDKVVEQLDEKSQLIRPVGWAYPQEVILTRSVLEIVKAGGIDE